MTLVLSPSIVPHEASLAITEHAIAKEACLNENSEEFAKSIKMKFSRGGDERMLTQNNDAFSMLSGKSLEPNAEIDFFRGEQFFAETANFTKRWCLAKYE